MELLDFKYYDYDRFRIEPLTKWADIIEGETYHIGPTIIYPRRDFLCEHKETDRLVGKMYDYLLKRWEPAILYQYELSVRFLVKRQDINTR